jgi:hypothetical protein
MIKECFKCKEAKPLFEFYKHKQMKDGHVNKCKKCNQHDVAMHRANNIDKIRAYDRGRGNRQDDTYVKEYRDKHPKKYKAHCLVNNHKRAGNISEMPCEVCKDIKVVAHHDDYDKPLNVRWLCYAHHSQWHAKHGEGLNAS